MAVHKSPRVRNTDIFVLQTLRNQIGCRIYPIHRLDRPTSGLLIFAFSSEAAAGLAHEFRCRNIQKSYFAVVRGFPAPKGRIEHPLQNSPSDPPRPAQTDFKRLAYIELPLAAVERYPTSRYALLHICPHTGRMHQIRKHCNRISHPIIGDYQHGDYRHNRFFAQQLTCSQLLLHAHTLQFRHPYTQLLTTLKAPFPAHWQQLCAQFGWHSVLEWIDKQ